MLKTDHPDPPSNLSLLLTPLEPFTISWIQWEQILGGSKLNVTIPPFTLPRVTLSYIVNVINLNTSRVFNSSELIIPSFNFSGSEDGSPCDVYQFTVTARNAAGWSDPSDTFIASLPSGKSLDQSLQHAYNNIYNLASLDLPTISMCLTPLLLQSPVNISCLTQWLTRCLCIWL